MGVPGVPALLGCAFWTTMTFGLAPVAVATLPPDNTYETKYTIYAQLDFSSV